MLVDGRVSAGRPHNAAALMHLFEKLLHGALKQRRGEKGSAVDWPLLWAVGLDNDDAQLEATSSR